jgi:hypothetical protein
LDVTFRSPLGALIALAVLIPLAAAAVAERRGSGARRRLALPPPPLRSRLAVPLALVALAAIVAVAGARPVLRRDRPRPVRSDAAVMFAIDISRSMLASRTAGSPNRLERAKATARRLRTALPDVPAGIASFTDRALPHLFPAPDAAAFAYVLDRAVGIERPPPRAPNSRATTFDALDEVAHVFFPERLRHRVVVVLTDGESRSFHDGELGEVFRDAHVRAVLVRIGSDREHVFFRGKPDPGYQPGGADEQIAAFDAATRGKSFSEHQVGAALGAIRDALGVGPRQRLGITPSTRELAPYVVLAGLVPLSLILWRRNR